MSINIEQVELLLQVHTADFCDYGASELDRERHIADWRARLGYSAYELKKIKENKPK